MPISPQPHSRPQPDPERIRAFALSELTRTGWPPEDAAELAEIAVRMPTPELVAAMLS